VAFAAAGWQEALVASDGPDTPDVRRDLLRPAINDAEPWGDTHRADGERHRALDLAG